MDIVTIKKKESEKFLRQKTVPFDFAARAKKDINELIKKMRKLMIAADGIGLAANQAGYSERFFVAQVPNEAGKMKFYAIFNPEIEKSSEETAEYEEGCLSVPEMFGMVPRPTKITLKGQDKTGKEIKIKAWGLLARVFQHEVDHLNGALFLDRATETHTLEDIKKRNVD